MKVGDMVEYVGGQDANGMGTYKLELDTPYIVAWKGQGNFKVWGRIDCIGLEGVIPDYLGFKPTMFRVIKTKEQRIYYVTIY